MPNAKQPPDDTPFSPTIGCLIIALAFIVLGGSATFFIYQGARMNREIDKFTDDQPVPRTVNSPTKEHELALRSRLDAFSKAALAGEKTQVALSAEEINDLIASSPLLKDFRGNTRITKIDDDFLVAEMSQTLNSLKPSQPRYLNATFHFRPRTTENGFDLALVDITSADKPIPRGFIDLYTQKKFFTPDPDHETLGPVLAKIRQIHTDKGKLILSTYPPE